MRFFSRAIGFPAASLGGLIGLLVLVSPMGGWAAGRTVVDDAGRKVEIPAVVDHVFAAGPPAGVLVYVVAPEKLMGWPYLRSEEARAYLAPRYADLPVIGRLAGRGSTASSEMVARLHPDMILDAGSIDPTYVSLAERVQTQTGIPYLLIDGRIADTPAMLRKAGDLLGVPERGNTLAGYAEGVLAEVTGRIASHAGEKRPSVYYARSADGLETGTKGSSNAELIDYLGAVNVAIEGDKGGMGRVSMEQVLRWDPDMIIVDSPVFFAEIAKLPLWRDLRAVREHRVYQAPPFPFGWIDAPPGVNRLIGVRWLAARFYPSLFPEDLSGIVREFYQLFYGVGLSDKALDGLLGAR
ncbi:iron ABC transporter substrate-binding protein [Telmatospirillum siberiense]|uniref:Iron ABC transporter substrate-binding protein n=1 Tax=Telmatospirillum siberiense TaxID=382514 RepID=A0A2N3PYV1_9PROT|nr:iron ABC transporter substrate-binding protein [Telmatospirillum siberiense]PKU25596.1 iron ABC transporter substrate-binding protein [Telmatospirillum siberiense]